MTPETRSLGRMNYLKSLSKVFPVSITAMHHTVNVKNLGSNPRRGAKFL